MKKLHSVEILEKNSSVSNGKLVASLRKMDKSRLKSFRTFVQSPYFNTHQNVKQLLDLILEWAPQFKGEKLTMPYLFNQIFEGESYRPQKISDLLTYLFRLFEKYMAIEEFQADENGHALSRLKAYYRSGMDKLFVSASKRLEKKDVASEESQSEQTQFSYQLNRMQSLFSATRQTRTIGKEIESETLSLDLFYLITKLKNTCEMINRQNIVKEEFRIYMLNDILRFLKSAPDEIVGHPGVKIYFTVLKTLLNEENEQHYAEMIASLKSDGSTFGRDELRTVYDYAQNYCIKKINSGHSEYTVELFKLYKELISKELIFENGQLSQWDYKNIVTVASRVNEEEWAERFIHQFKDSLPKQDRENAFAYNLATLFYTGKKYDKALRLLQTVEFTDVYYGLGARCLLLKAYFETNETEALFSLFDSFKIYLKRNKQVSKYQFDAHNNLLKLTKRLTNIKLRGISSRKETIAKEIAKLRQRVDVTARISNKDWLVGEMGD